MNVKPLCAAVQNGWSDWMEHFNRQEYEKSFRKYMECYGELYAQAVREADGDEAALQALAAAILDELEAGWKKQRIWNRSRIRFEEMQVIINYLSPMLLELPDPKCGRLAGMLRQGWADRWPKEEYHITTFEIIQKGFRFAIMGIDLTGMQRDRERERK